MTDSADVIKRVLEVTSADVERARMRAQVKFKGRARKKFNEQLSFSIYFARHFGTEIARAFGPEFGVANVQSGEVPSASAEGSKRLDVSYSTRESGLGFMVSLKSVHQGEEDDGSARFCHNLKRNDEELRVEATALHIRQPYAVLVATMILPFEACEDGWRQGRGPVTSSFARWVERFWGLKGRLEPEDPPNLFELVFIALYARNGSDLAFYRVGGRVPCPRVGRPEPLLDFEGYLARIREEYYRRNGRDFRFAGEAMLGMSMDDDEEI